MLPCIALSERELHTYKPINAKPSGTDPTEGLDKSQLYVGEATYRDGEKGPALFAYETEYEPQWVIFPVSFKGDNWHQIEGARNVVLAKNDIRMTQEIVQQFYPTWQDFKPELMNCAPRVR